MLKKIKSILFFGNFPRSELRTIGSLAMEENRKFCFIWSVFHVLFWTYSLIMSFSGDPLYMKCRWIYAAALAGSALVLAVSLFDRAHPRLIRAAALFLNAVLFLGGDLIARNLAPQTILIFAAVLMVPVMFIMDTFSIIVQLLANFIAFFLIGRGSMEPDIFKWVLSNLIIFSVMGTMLGHFVNKTRFERYVFSEANAEFARQQARNARFDRMTDMLNRRSYAEEVDRLEAAGLPAGCRVVIADINGLKETNDTKGHNAGDELVIAAAECLRGSFEGIDKVYRIGGDEFCVIVTDGEYDVEGALKRLQESSAAWKGKYISGISISAGFASAGEFGDINEMVKEADKRMYAAKRAYYMSPERDRRRR